MRKTPSPGSQIALESGLGSAFEPTPAVARADSTSEHRDRFRRPAASRGAIALAIAKAVARRRAVPETIIRELCVFRSGRQLRCGDYGLRRSSGATAGPSSTEPSTAKREPWQGQSQERSAALKRSTQPRWVQPIETACKVPSSPQ